jgi:hypothetical protein
MKPEDKAVVQKALDLAASWQKTCLDCGRSSEELGRATSQLAALRQLLEPEPVQEQLCQHWRTISDGSPENEYCYDCKKFIGLAAQPAAQPQREWVDDAGRLQWALWRIKELEAKLREKNAPTQGETK